MNVQIRAILISHKKVLIFGLGISFLSPPQQKGRHEIKHSKEINQDIYIYIRKGRAIVGTGENPKLQTYKNAYNTLVNCGQDDR